MKTIKLITMVVLLCSIQNYAQITKGNWMVGGSGYFSNISIKDGNQKIVQSSSQLILQPNLGYFFYDRLAGGLITSFSYSNVSGISSSNSGLGIGPYIRYYFLKPEKTINILVEANYFYGKDFNESDFTNSYGFKVGPVIYFNSSVGLEFLAKYDHSFYSNDSYTADNFQIGIGLQIHLQK